jgi:hypothetical protein
VSFGLRKTGIAVTCGGFTLSLFRMGPYLRLLPVITKAYELIMPRVLALSSLCDHIFTGIPPRAKSVANSSESRIPVIGIRAITNDGILNPEGFDFYELPGSLPKPIRPLQRGDVLMSIRGNAPKSSLIECDFDAPTFASGNLAVLRPNAALMDSTYLWCVLMSICATRSHPLLTRATTGQLAVRISALSALQISVPNLADQQLIGAAGLALRAAINSERQALLRGERMFAAFFQKYITSS